MQLKHGLMGQFPALFSHTMEPFICVDRELLKKVWERLPRKKAEIIEILILFHPGSNTCFSLEGRGKERLKTEPLTVLTEEDLTEMTAVEGAEPFKWAPGLISFTDKSHISPPA